MHSIFPDGYTPEYRIRFSSFPEPVTYRTMFNRADMSFFGFSAGDVIPPAGHTLEFDYRGEPYFAAPVPPARQLPQYAGPAAELLETRAAAVERDRCICGGTGWIPGVVDDELCLRCA